MNYINIILPLTLLFIACNSDDDDYVVPYSPYNGHSTAVFDSTISYGSVTDRDGNIYKTVVIGTQTWMAENLRTTTYNDGTAIPNVTDNEEWSNLTSEAAYCTYNNTSNIDTIATYGCLYNCPAVLTGKLAPEGWHVPSKDEWALLNDYLGGKGCGGLLKETDTLHWLSPNTGATNKSGFTALPVGIRNDSGKFVFIGVYGWFWSSTEDYPNFAWLRTLDCYSVQFTYRISGLCGFSVRCVKD